MDLQQLFIIWRVLAMAVITEIIRVNEDGSLSFGNYELTQKTKVLDFEVAGRFYKAKTFKEVTKLKRDGVLVYESLPGTAVHELVINDEGVSFKVEGIEATQITLELQPQTEYKIIIDEVIVDHIQTMVSGKINFSLEATDKAKEVVVKKIG